MGGAARPSSSYSSSSLGGGAAPVAAAGHSHSDRMDTSSDASMAMGMLHHGAGSVAGMPFGADIVMLPAIPQGVADVDKDDKADPACVADYAREIHAHQRSEEVSLLPVGRLLVSFSVLVLFFFLAYGLDRRMISFIFPSPSLFYFPSL
jgi:hypothetical protein